MRLASSSAAILQLPKPPNNCKQVSANGTSPHKPADNKTTLEHNSRVVALGFELHRHGDRAHAARLISQTRRHNVLVYRFQNTFACYISVQQVKDSAPDLCKQKFALHHSPTQDDLLRR